MDFIEYMIVEITNLNTVNNLVLYLIYTMMRSILFILFLSLSLISYSQNDYKLVSVYKNQDFYVFVNLKGCYLDSLESEYKISDSIYTSYIKGESLKLFDKDGVQIAGSWKIEDHSPKTKVVYFDCMKKEF